jgi:hypothetical protein
MKNINLNIQDHNISSNFNEVLKADKRIIETMKAKHIVLNE